MGGKALKKVKASRIGLEQYVQIKNDLMEKLNKYFQIEFVIEVPNKTDFGDVDVLYDMTDFSNLTKSDEHNSFQSDKITIDQIILREFNPVEIVMSGPVCSFAYKFINASEENNSTQYFQVDLIQTKNIEMSRFYFSYGDLGGIIGRIFQHNCLTFGSEGLRVHPNVETIYEYITKYYSCVEKHIANLNHNIKLEQISKGQFEKIYLSTNPKEICDVLELNWNKWVEGFNNTNEIYNWICNSPWFNLDYFRALDCEHRHRASSRPMYQDFLKYIFTMAGEPNFTIECANSSKYLNKNCQLSLLIRFSKLPELQLQIENEYKRLERKEKFSGKIFLDGGISQKNMKNCLNEFNAYIEQKYLINFNEWLDANSAKLISDEVDNFIVNFKQKSSTCDK